jgi:hypothetical protein
MTGDDQPLPWIAVFHRTFRVSLHVSGRFGAAAMPVPSGPRNCGQSARSAMAADTTRMAMNGSEGRVVGIVVPPA